MKRGQLVCLSDVKWTKAMSVSRKLLELGSELGR